MKTYTITLLLILVAFSNIYSQIWEKTTAEDTATVWSLAINSNGDIFAGTQNAGIFRSTDNGATWTNLGILGYTIRTIAINSFDIIFTAGYEAGGVYRSTNEGDNWESLPINYYNQAIIFKESNGYIFLGTGAIGIYRSTDNGTNWEEKNVGLGTLNLWSFVINSSGDIFACTYNNGVYKSTNDGDNWGTINSGLSNLDLRAIAINSSGHIFVGSEGGGVFRSTDNGDNWVSISQGLTGDALYVYALATSSGGNVIAGTAVGVYRSTDNGDSWSDINEGLTNTTVHSLAINPSGIVFAGTEGGIFKSLSSLPVELTSFKAIIKHNQVKLSWETATEVDNYGFEIEREINSTNNTEWEKIGFVKGNGNSNSPKEYFFIDNSLYGGSKFKYRLKQIDTDGQFEYSEIVEVESEPNQFELSQNYPNPFNPNTTIKFSLPKATQIKINLYNMLGEQVATLAEGNYETGNYKVTFNASSLPSGTYIYRIESSDFTQIKKMILLK